MSERALPALSPAETEVLRIVWQSGQATVQRVLDGLPRDRGIAYATVQTLLRRLERKGYVAHERGARPTSSARPFGAKR